MSNAQTWDDGTQELFTGRVLKRFKSATQRIQQT